MKYLIINADDFGNSSSINKGIIGGMDKGVITSTSLMVSRKYAHEVEQIKDRSNISIGLHFELPKDKNSSVVEELYRQINLFKELVGRNPDHLDAHKIRPKNIEGLHQTLQEYSIKNKTPIRDWGHANFIDEFFGLSLEGKGPINLDKITPQALITTLIKNLEEGYNELMCHAGHVDDEVRATSGYNDPREVELASLLSQDFKDYLYKNPDIKLVSWNEVTF